MLLRHKRLAHSSTGPINGVTKPASFKSSPVTLFTGVEDAAAAAHLQSCDLQSTITHGDRSLEDDTFTAPSQSSAPGQGAGSLPWTADPNRDEQQGIQQLSNVDTSSPSFAFEGERTNPQVLESNDFDNYLMFLDDTTFPPQGYSSLPQFQQPLPSFSPDPMFYMPDIVSHQIMHQDVSTHHARDGNDEQSSYSCFGSRLPSLQPEDPQRPPSPPKTRRHSFAEISPESRSQLSSRMEDFQHVVPKRFVLPTRHALSRYLAGYITGFHEHLPFLHVPTMSISTTSVDLVLAIAAVGAQYCREPERSVQIFHVAYTVAMECVQARDRRASAGHAPMRRQSRGTESVQTPSTLSSERDILKDVPGSAMETIQALLLLMAMATWFEEKTLARAAMTIRSQLESLAHDQGLEMETLANDPTWEEWVHYEGIKRSKFIVYCFLNLHSIVFDVPPLILNRDLLMPLPCTETQWRAKSALAWASIWRNREHETYFQQAFSRLFTDQSVEADEATDNVSTLGGYILIHALVQHIWFAQQTARYQTISVDVSTLEKALRSWQISWSRNPESSVDPLSPHGPVSFNSSALLRIAYIRINVDTGPIRSLRSWDPVQIATSITKSARVTRSKRMTRAALHCAHVLSIPVKLGIDFVAHTQMFFWSTQHALCSLECALLLTKWLECVTATRPDEPALTVDETKVLNFVRQMVEETDFSTAAEPQEDVSGRHLGAAVVRLWAKLFRSDTIWPMIDIIGRSLMVYAEMVEVP